MITYERHERNRIHSALRWFVGRCAGTAPDSARHYPDPLTRDATAAALIDPGRRWRNRPPAQRKRRLACVAGIAIALAAMIAPSRPVAAHDGAAASSFVYLPAVGEIDRHWFTDAELESTMRRAGYDPAVVTMHTWCELSEAAQPPLLILYANCTQQTDQDGNPSDAMATVYLRTGGAMQWNTISAIHSQEPPP